MYWFFGDPGKVYVSSFLPKSEFIIYLMILFHKNLFLNHH